MESRRGWISFSGRLRLLAICVDEMRGVCGSWAKRSGAALNRHFCNYSEIPQIKSNTSKFHQRNASHTHTRHTRTPTQRQTHEIVFYAIGIAKYNNRILNRKHTRCPITNYTVLFLIFFRSHTSSSSSEHHTRTWQSCSRGTVCRNPCRTAACSDSLPAV